MDVLNINIILSLTFSKNVVTFTQGLFIYMDSDSILSAFFLSNLPVSVFHPPVCVFSCILQSNLPTRVFLPVSAFLIHPSVYFCLSDLPLYLCMFSLFV